MNFESCCTHFHIIINGFNCVYNSHRASSLDPQDAQIAMYLALQLALVRQVRTSKQTNEDIDIWELRPELCLLGIRSHGAPADSSVSAWGRCPVPPPAHAAAQCPETPP